MRKEHSKVIFSINFSHYFNSYTIFGIISNTLSALYNKRPLEAVIVLFIFVEKFTILFFSCFFSKLGNRTAYHSMTAYHSNTAYHSTTAYRSNVKKNNVVEFSRGVRLSFDDRLSFEHPKKHCCRVFQECSLIIRRPLIVRTYKKTSCRVFQGCSLIIRRPLVFRTYQKTLWS